MVSPAFAQGEAPIPKPQSTIQQMFDAGTAAIEKGDWKAAAAIYTELETRLGSRSANTRNLAIVRLRKAISEIGSGDDGDGPRDQLKAALAALPTGDVSLNQDRRSATLALGSLAERRFDYAGADSMFRTAVATSTGTTQTILAYNRLIPVAIFVDPARALADADTALAVLATEPKAQREWPGLLRTYRGRALLNLNRPQEARKELDAAIKAFGGLGYGKVDFLDVAARGDAAIAAYLTKDPAKARGLTAMTGAAMQSTQGFQLGQMMEPPPCDAKNGIRPEDVAVIELAIGKDGSVAYAKPIYFSGRPQSAIEFARVVAGWAWTPEELKQVSPFFRRQTRIEMRCTTVFNRPNTIGLAYPPAEEWLRKVSPAVSITAPTAAVAVDQLKAELARLKAESPTNRLALLTSLVALASIGANSDAGLYAAEALEIVKTSDAPPAALAYFHLLAAAYDRTAYGGDRNSPYQKRLRQALETPLITNNPAARSAIRIAMYDALRPNAREQSGRAMIAAVANDDALPPNDPFRVGALVRMANLEAAAGKVDDARSLFEKTGLSEQQCALADAKPGQTKGTISDRDYPSEAIRLGFGGWTVTEFDIAADGVPKNVRPLIAFPPFIFGEPTAKQVATFRYEQTFRPGGSLGCGGQRQRVSYRTVNFGQ